MNIVVDIDGEAIPLRAVPFATDWLLSHDILAAGHEPSMPTFRLEGSGYVPMTKGDWITVAQDLEVLQARLTMADTFEDDNRSRWRVESLALIPAGCFVWRTDLEAALRTARFSGEDDDLDELISLAEPTEDDGKPIAVPAKNADFQLNLSPFVPPELAGLVMEGFAPQAASEAEDPVLTRKPENHDERQSRRLDRYRALGGERVPNGGGGWKASGERGALARLAREEAIAEHPYSDVRDVARDLNAEVDRRRAGQAMPRS